MTIEVLNSNGSWSLWKDEVNACDVPGVLFRALLVFGTARVGNVVYTRTEA